MVFCGKCGYWLTSGDTVCPRCGTPTDPDLILDDSPADSPTIASSPMLGIDQTQPKTQGPTAQVHMRNRHKSLSFWVQMAVIMVLLSRPPCRQLIWLVNHLPEHHTLDMCHRVWVITHSREHRIQVTHRRETPATKLYKARPDLHLLKWRGIEPGVA